MAAEDYLRLAWHADRDGRAGMRDALLTLAVAESGPDGAVLAERCRKRLVAGRPEHWFASFATVGEALGHPKVIEAMAELRAAYPAVRVERLLLRGEARGGPYTGRPKPLARVVDDLVGPGEHIRRPTLGSGDHIDDVPALLLSAGDDDSPAGSIRLYYLTVLLAMAIVLHTALEPSAQDSKAA